MGNAKAPGPATPASNATGPHEFRTEGYALFRHLESPALKGFHPHGTTRAALCGTLSGLVLARPIAPGGAPRGRARGCDGPPFQRAEVAMTVSGFWLMADI